VIIQKWAGHQSITTTYQCYIAVTPRDQQMADDLRLSRKSKKVNGQPLETGLDEKMRVIVQLWKDGILSDEEFKVKVDRLVI
jgi:hypothetical protein